MVQLIWGLVGMGVVVGIALGATLGIRMDLGKMSDGTMLTSSDGSKEADIIVKAAAPNDLKQILIGIGNMVFCFLSGCDILNIGR